MSPFCFFFLFFFQKKKENNSSSCTRRVKSYPDAEHPYVAFRHGKLRLQVGILLNSCDWNGSGDGTAVRKSCYCEKQLGH